jgi:asparagine synthase (glutamine-hydrolysing)
MAHSLEVREPLMDHHLVEWLASLPSSLKMKGGEGKHILKKTMEKYLSNDLLYRQKMGFRVPLASWFRGPLRKLVREILLGENIVESGLFNMDCVSMIVDQNEKGIRDYSAVIWELLMFEGFLKKIA